MFFYFTDLFHGCDGKKMTLATCISNDICSLREHLALVNKTACKNILFCFTIVILEIFFGPPLCVLVKIDKHPCVTK